MTKDKQVQAKMAERFGRVKQELELAEQIELEEIKRLDQKIKNDQTNVQLLIERGHYGASADVDGDYDAWIAIERAAMLEPNNVDVLFWDETPLSIEIAPKVTLEIKETNPGIKGNTASNIYKPAILENGLKVKVPLFIKVGDKIRVDTRSGE